ncbi:uncharacterized protein METZ01_LOCUS278613, partial [marine metagenome]
VSKEIEKENSAEKAFELIKHNLFDDTVLGIGTGSTSNFFIKILIRENPNIKGAVCSSKVSHKLLSNSSINILQLNEVHKIDFYIDGADEVNRRLELIKGGGGALTSEKILANSSNKFICIADDSKLVDVLGKFPLPIEVIRDARSAIAREIIQMGAKPVFREGFLTDHGNQIIDIHNLKIKVPFEMEGLLNNIPGIVENGIFAKRKADMLLLASEEKVEIINTSK